MGVHIALRSVKYPVKQRIVNASAQEPEHQRISSKAEHPNKNLKR